MISNYRYRHIKVYITRLKNQILLHEGSREERTRLFLVTKQLTRFLEQVDSVAFLQFQR